MITAIDEIRGFLRTSKSVSLGYSEINFFDAASLEDEQTGYSIDATGAVLTGNKGDDWQSNWIVVGNDGVGDPVIVDIGSSDLTVFSAMHGEGRWEPFRISDSLTSFQETIKLLDKLSNGRSSPDELDRNPIAEGERERILSKIKLLNPNSEMEYWAVFLED